MLYHFGGFEVDTEEHRLAAGGVSIPLEPKTLLLLSYLLERPGKLVRKQELLQAMWPNTVVTENSLTRSMAQLRRAIGDNSREPQFIETIPTVGYRFIAEVNSVHADASQPDGVPPAAPTEPAASELSSEIRLHGERAGEADVPVPAPRTAARRWPLQHRVVAGAAAALIVVSVWMLTHHGHAAASASSPNAYKGKEPSAHGEAISANSEAARDEIRRGLFFFDKRNAPASEAAFRHAIELDPQSSSAHAGLSQALTTRSLLSTVASPAVIANAEEEGRKAVALDPENGAAYIALGTVQTIFTWEWTEGEKNLKHGLQLSPHSATGNMWYAAYLDSAGRPEEAIERIRMAVEDDPLSFFVLRMQASVLYFGRHYDEALRVLERAREMSPSQTAILDNWVSWIDEQRGLYDEAVEHELNWLHGSFPNEDPNRLRATYRRGGWEAYWKLRLEGMHPETQAGCGLYSVGRAYLRIDERDQALEAFRKAAEQHCFWMNQILVDPGLDDLRKDPRFPQLVALVDPKHELSRVR